MVNQGDRDIRWSIITVAYNSADVLRRHWSSPIPDDVEWIVVDNNSADSSVQTARELGAKVIELGRNAGFSAANNSGMASATGQYIGFVNPDVFVQWDSLVQLETLIDASGAIVSPSS
ncbi:glycosyltransferase [Arthrobacter sp. 24S4-2]|uniref:glycosyltransferase n=1 Tax=Arthrobacter sp. 24S4-2 TaxID=2575374 RepID=UPI0010C7BD97|nr:glycosyltransferase [Arthrobacter sp. 24S4-2]QCO99611.1 glycosyltransferase [Arthrobacter sp. 24S4-2]